MYDKIETYGKSVFQHGKMSNRIYLMDLNPDDIATLLPHLDELVKKNKYTKIIAKVPARFEETFINYDFIKEAWIPNFFNGKEDVCFMSKFFTEERIDQKEKVKAIDVLEKAIDKDTIEDEIDIDDQFSCRILNRKDASLMVEVFNEVFETYPFPIFDENYIIETMQSHIVYFGIWHREKLVAVASCEMNLEKSYVEMTDFAILKHYRGNNFATYLLSVMEEQMIQQGIKTAYTMSRALSYGMNMAFSKLGYRYKGTLINNANINQGIESLNIWYKHL